MKGQSVGRLQGDREMCTICKLGEEERVRGGLLNEVEKIR